MYPSATQEAKKELAEIQSTIAEVEQSEFFFQAAFLDKESCLWRLCFRLFLSGENQLETKVLLSLVVGREARPVEVTEGNGDEQEKRQRCVEIKVRK